MTTHAAIYSRCSTDEKRQDTEVQLKELRRYARAYDWIFDEISEYGSGFKGDGQPKLEKIIEKIRLRHYSILLVHSLDRFSREHPKKTNALLDRIVYDYGCRFISLKENLDSQDEMTWHAIRPIFSYFSNLFSRTLSDKIKAGIQNKKAKNDYHGGRPKKEYDLKRLASLRSEGYSIRKIAVLYNLDLARQKQISHTQVGRILSDQSRGHSARI